MKKSKSQKEFKSVECEMAREALLNSKEAAESKVKAKKLSFMDFFRIELPQNSSSKIANARSSKSFRDSENSVKSGNSENSFQVKAAGDGIEPSPSKSFDSINYNKFSDFESKSSIELLFGEFSRDGFLKGVGLHFLIFVLVGLVGVSSAAWFNYSAVKINNENISALSTVLSEIESSSVKLDQISDQAYSHLYDGDFGKFKSETSEIFDSLRALSSAGGSSEAAGIVAPVLSLISELEEQVSRVGFSGSHGGTLNNKTEMIKKDIFGLYHLAKSKRWRTLTRISKSMLSILEKNSLNHADVMDLNNKFKAFVNVYEKSRLLPESKKILSSKITPLRNPLAILFAESEEISNKLSGIDPGLKKLQVILADMSNKTMKLIAQEKEQADWNFKVSNFSLASLILFWMFFVPAALFRIKNKFKTQERILRDELNSVLSSDNASNADENLKILPGVFEKFSQHITQIKEGVLNRQKIDFLTLKGLGLPFALYSKNDELLFKSELWNGSELFEDEKIKLQIKEVKSQESRKIRTTLEQTGEAIPVELYVSGVGSSHGQDACWHVLRVRDLREENELIEAQIAENVKSASKRLKKVLSGFYSDQNFEVQSAFSEMQELHKLISNVSNLIHDEKEAVKSRLLASQRQVSTSNKRLQFFSGDYELSIWENQEHSNDLRYIRDTFKILKKDHQDLERSNASYLKNFSQFKKGYFEIYDRLEASGEFIQLAEKIMNLHSPENSGPDFSQSEIEQSLEQIRSVALHLSHMSSMELLKPRDIFSVNEEIREALQLFVMTYEKLQSSFKSYEKDRTELVGFIQSKLSFGEVADLSSLTNNLNAIESDLSKDMSLHSEFRKRFTELMNVMNEKIDEHSTVIEAYEKSNQKCGDFKDLVNRYGEISDSLDLFIKRFSDSPWLSDSFLASSSSELVDIESGASADKNTLHPELLEAEVPASSLPVKSGNA